MGHEAKILYFAEGDGTGETTVTDPPVDDVVKPTGERSVDDNGNLLITPGEPADKGEGFDVNTLFNPEGVFKKGKFDQGEERVTKELIEANPVIARILQSEHDHQAEVTKLKQGKIVLKEPMTEEGYNGIDWSLSDTEDGQKTLTEETIKALKGQPIGDREIAFLAALLDRATTADRTRNEEWNEGWNTKMEGNLDTVIQWARENYSPEAVEDITAQLKNPELREDQMERLYANWQRAVGDGTANLKPKMKTGNTDTTTPDGKDEDNPAGKGPVGLGLFSEDHNTRMGELVGERLRAGGSPSKLKQINDKLARTIAQYGG